MNKCFCQSNSNQFAEWFVQLIGPVLMGAKPAEILSFPYEEEHNARLSSIKSCMERSSKLVFREFSYCKKCTKLFIYNPKALEETLSDKRSQRLLKQLGYPSEYNLEDYIAALMLKMEGGMIPDEIGVFLGYPLKDVIGFMGHASLKLTKIKGWRVYGDPRASDKKYNDFMEARKSIMEMLTHSSPDRIMQVV